MIFEALSILKAELEQYIRLSTGSTSTEEEVVLGNISQAEGTTTTAITNKVVLTLLKLEEDVTLKNGPTRIREGERYKKENRPVHTYAFVLITAHYPDNYANALKRIGHVVKFFQGKSIFTHANSPLVENDEVDGIESLNMNLELISPTFEQLNHIWGVMGGKSHPAVLYKARLLVLKRDAPQDFEEPITHIIINE